MSSNINSEDIDIETKEKLKGDLIGETMYSESFIVKTLLRFNNEEWNDDFETDLCFLWDMSTEKDVCDYLFRLSFPSIACDVISNEPDNRLVEILIGILGNINIPDNVPAMEVKGIECVLKYLDTDDHLILIQVMRFLKAISYKSKDKLDVINPSLMNKVAYVLSNSLNDELLENTLDALAKMTDKKVEVNCLSADLLKAVLDAVTTIYESEKDAHPNIYALEKIRKSTNYFAQILINISTYLDDELNMELRNDIKGYNNRIVNHFYTILKSYYNDYEVDVSTNDLVFVAESLGYICPILNITSGKLFSQLLHLFQIVSERFENDDTLKKTLLEVLCYFISKMSLEEYKRFATPGSRKGLFLIKQSSFDCDYVYHDNMNCMIKLHEDVNHCD